MSRACSFNFFLYIYSLWLYMFYTFGFESVIWFGFTVLALALSKWFTLTYSMKDNIYAAFTSFFSTNYLLLFSKTSIDWSIFLSSVILILSYIGLSFPSYLIGFVSLEICGATYFERVGVLFWINWGYWIGYIFLAIAFSKDVCRSIVTFVVFTICMFLGFGGIGDFML